MSSREAAGWLAAQRDALAVRITALQYAAWPELEARYGAHGREKCRQDAAYHLSYLEQAVGSGQPALFSEYVAWAKILLAHLNIPGADLKSNLAFVGQAVGESAPGHLERNLVAPVEAVLDIYDSLPTESPSYLDPSHPRAGLARRYLNLLLAGDRRGASRLILDAVESGTPVRDIYLGVFQPAQYEIGRLWQTNQVTVAQEHYCTAATQLIMSQLYPQLFAGEKNGLKLVVACVSGDLHEIGARVVTDLFEADGWDTFYIGANTPTQSLVTTVEDERPNVLALSATMTEHVDRVRAAIVAVRRVQPQLPIMVGGYPFIKAPELWRELGADGTAVDAEQAIQLGTALTER